MTPIAILQRDAAGLDLAAFVARYSHPALVLFPGSERRAGADAPQTTRVALGPADEQGLAEEWLTKTHEDLDVDELRYRGGGAGAPSLEELQGAAGVAFLRKHPTHPSPFPNMVTLGRVARNDVELPYPAVSKVHACALQGERGDEWFLVDQSSTNGTWVEGVRLERGQKQGLKDGAWLNIGAALGARFLLPASLFGFLERRRAQAGAGAP